MDKIQLLRQRRSKVLAAGKEIRKTIAALTDAESFVELSGFSFSKNDFYDGFSGETVSKDGVFDGAVEGEGVVTGFATIGGYPMYIAAQNFEVLHGGVSAANCAKLMKCLSLAEKNSTPVVYVLHSLGVQIGEGVTVLEGLASLIAKAAKLHGIVPQFAVVNGEVYGQSSLLAACADFTFFMKDGVLAADSPLVLSAKSGQNLAKEEVGGAAALGKTNLVSFEAASYADVRASIEKILGLIPAYGALVEETGADLNATFPALNKKCDADALIKCVFDAGSCVEFGKTCSPAVRSLLATLPETERRIIELRFFAGKSQREVAAQLNVSQMTVSRAERRASRCAFCAACATWPRSSASRRWNATLRVTRSICSASTRRGSTTATANSCAR